MPRAAPDGAGHGACRMAPLVPSPPAGKVNMVTTTTAPGATGTAPGPSPQAGGAAAVGNQRAPAEGARVALPPPAHAYRRTRDERRDATLARALGWFSVGLGVAELGAPHAFGRA